MTQWGVRPCLHSKYTLSFDITLVRDTTLQAVGAGRVWSAETIPCLEHGGTLIANNLCLSDELRYLAWMQTIVLHPAPLGANVKQTSFSFLLQECLPKHPFGCQPGKCQCWRGGDAGTAS